MNEFFDAAARRHVAVSEASGRHPSSSPGVLEIRLAAELIRAEIARARRYERPFAVVWLPMCGTTDLGLVRNVIRETDAVAAGQSGLVVVLPETDRRGASVCAGRLVTATSVDRDSLRVVNFPESAVTVGGLCRMLEHGDAGPMHVVRGVDVEDLPVADRLSA